MKYALQMGLDAMPNFIAICSGIQNLIMENSKTQHDYLIFQILYIFKVRKAYWQLHC
jgi:hypothetical protein